MEDVLSVYQRPYDEKYPLICMDEMSKQLVDEVRSSLPMKSGQVERIDYEYKRNGTANIFMLVEPLAGRRQVKVTERRTKKDWASLMKDVVDIYYPKVEKIVMVLDNLNTHVKSSLYETFEPDEAKRIADKLELHYTPKHGSWLNIAECELSILSRQCLDRRIPDMAMLKKEISVWEHARNNSKAVVDWQFTTEDARIKLKSLYPTL